MRYSFRQKLSAFLCILHLVVPSLPAATVCFKNTTGANAQYNNGNGFQVQWKERIPSQNYNMSDASGWNNAGNGPTSLPADGQACYSKDEAYMPYDWQYAVRWVHPQTMEVFAQGYATPYQTVTVSVGPPPCKTNIYMGTIKNTDSKWRVFQIVDGNGQPVGGPSGTTGTVIAPGASAKLQSPLVDCNTSTNGWNIKEILGAYTIGAYGNGLTYFKPNEEAGGSWGVGSWGGWVEYQGASTGSGTSSASSGPGTPSVYDPTKAGSTSGILFTDTNANSTVQGQGFQGLYDSITKGNADTGDQLRKLNATATEILNGITNGTATGQSDSNYLQSAMASGTNDQTAAAQSATAGPRSSLDGLISKAQGFASVPAKSGGAAMTIAFIDGQSLNLDPAERFPGLQNMLFYGFTFFLGLYFLQDVSKLVNNTVATFATAKTGGVPNLEASAAGFGGNMLGAAAAVVTPTVFIALWVAVMVAVFAILSNVVLDATAMALWSSGLGSIGWYLLSSMFPVDLFVGLVVTRIILQFTVAKVVMVAAAASRFIWGN